MKRKMSLFMAKSLFKYDPKRGILLWDTARKGIRRGQPAGSMVNGIMYVTVDWQRYKVKDLVWLLHTGVWPSGTLYHKDHNKKNVAIENLARSKRGPSPSSRNFSVEQNEGGWWEVRSNGRMIKTLEPEKTEELLALLTCLVRY